ncbi:MAG: hypothetical protein INR69_00600 [Mucilaginibacter polytrichastri]|nr:hypothetical protein [Mucilaginibacter polytrichastri]
MLLRENIPVKYVFGKIWNEVILTTVYVSAVVILHQNFLSTKISIPLGVPTILGTVISLLLAFKSNQAYDRWWEARTLWGAIVNDSRSFSRQVRSFIDNVYGTPEIDQLRRTLIKRQIAWCYSLGQSLRKQNPLGGLERLLSEDDINYLKKFDNVPFAILDLQAHDINRAAKHGWINDFQQVSMDRMLSQFSTSMGACERIKNTIFPVTYSLYIHFSLVLFIMLLPFGLIEYFSFMVVPFTIAIASSFLLIEKMAIHLQDPFENRPTDTPVTTISQKIERDLKQMLEEHVTADDATLDRIAGKKAYYVL